MACSSSHQGIVQLRSAGRIQDQDGKTAFLGFIQGVHGQLGRRHALLVKDRNVQALAQRLQLADGRRTVRVGGDQHDPLALRTQGARQLTGGGGFPGALQAHQHQDARFRAAQI